MEVKQIKRLYEAMEANGFTTLEIELGKNEALKLKLDNSFCQPVEESVECGECDDIKTTQIEIRSDKVGVFSFAEKVLKVGDQIKKGEILGTVKGISFQDRIKCSASGKISAVPVKNGEVVDYGKLLLLVEID